MDKFISQNIWFVCFERCAASSGSAQYTPFCRIIDKPIFRTKNQEEPKMVCKKKENGQHFIA